MPLTPSFDVFHDQELLLGSYQIGTHTLAEAVAYLNKVVSLDETVALQYAPSWTAIHEHPGTTDPIHTGSGQSFSVVCGGDFPEDNVMDVLTEDHRELAEFLAFFDPWMIRALLLDLLTRIRAEKDQVAQSALSRIFDGQRERINELETLVDHLRRSLHQMEGRYIIVPARKPGWVEGFYNREQVVALVQDQRQKIDELRALLDELNTKANNLEAANTALHRERDTDADKIVTLEWSLKELQVQLTNRVAERDEARMTVTKLAHDRDVLTEELKAQEVKLSELVQRSDRAADEAQVLVERARDLERRVEELTYPPITQPIRSGEHPDPAAPWLDLSKGIPVWLAEYKFQALGVPADMRGLYDQSLKGHSMLMSPPDLTLMIEEIIRYREAYHAASRDLGKALGRVKEVEATNLRSEASRRDLKGVVDRQADTISHLVTKCNDEHAIALRLKREVERLVAMEKEVNAVGRPTTPGVSVDAPDALNRRQLPIAPWGLLPADDDDEHPLVPREETKLGSALWPPALSAEEIRRFQETVAQRPTRTYKIHGADPDDNETALVHPVYEHKVFNWLSEDEFRSKLLSMGNEGWKLVSHTLDLDGTITHYCVFARRQP